MSDIRPHAYHWESSDKAIFLLEWPGGVPAGLYSLSLDVEDNLPRGSKRNRLELPPTPQDPRTRSALERLRKGLSDTMEDAEEHDSAWANFLHRYGTNAYGNGKYYGD